jgi:thiaminase/transcriptional activator TenA
VNDALLSDHLRRVGIPHVKVQREHPTVIALCDGTLDDFTAREWLGQDYLFLLKERQTLARLAGQAPPEHLEDLFTLLVGVCTTDLVDQAALCDLFGADPSTAVLRAAATAYTDWLWERSAVYEEGLIALFAGLWGYSTLGSLMSVPGEARCATWVGSYRSEAFAALALRYAHMVDELEITVERAEEVFLEGMGHEMAFWDPM